MFLLFSSYNFDLIYSEQKTDLLTKIPVVILHRRFKEEPEAKAKVVASVWGN